MPDDQLLRAHEMMEYVYNVADVAYPVSIRDQMNRARWLVEKAHALGFFGPVRDPDFRRLLVCGAGAAGVTAALRAAVDLNVDTVLVEKTAAPFQRQRLCTSRWVDPTQYDWSADHWTAGVFPHAGPAMPLDWPADRSHRLALRWHLRLAGALGHPRLTFRRPDHVVGAPVVVKKATGEVGVQVSFASGAKEVFGMMLWCVGFGAERVYARRAAPPDYQGFGFWETDPFERPHWGVAPPPDDLCALVSGGGDGAIQDVLRLATRQKSALDLYQAVRASGWSMPDNVRHALFAAEDQAQRALTWCQPRSADEHKALDELHAAYAAAVRFLVARGPGSNLLVPAVQQQLAANPHPVLLVHPCTHFARGYALNHFLVLLLAEVARVTKWPAGPRILDRHGLVEVKGHACAGNPWGCHGAAHQVDLEARPSCHGPGGGVVVRTEPAHVLVVRHGISPHPAFAGTPLAFARQIMPYHLP